MVKIALYLNASPQPSQSPMPNIALGNGRSSLDYFYCCSGAHRKEESLPDLTVVAATVGLVWYK